MITATAAAVLAAVLNLATPMVKDFEGYSSTAYRDSGGKLTICWGHTTDVATGDQRTDAECQALLESDLRTAYNAITGCIEDPESLTTDQLAALTSWAFNVGTSAACRSTLVKKLNRGDQKERWCAELLRWKYSKGRVLRGLVKRRAIEHNMCIGATDD